MYFYLNFHVAKVVEKSNHKNISVSKYQPYWHATLVIYAIMSDIDKRKAIGTMFECLRV